MKTGCSNAGHDNKTSKNELVLWQDSDVPKNETCARQSQMQNFMEKYDPRSESLSNKEILSGGLTSVELFESFVTGFNFHLNQTVNINFIVRSKSHILWC